jgi:histidyl-tRNA synthetase
MSKLDTAPYKGVRDFYPEDQFIQNHIFNVWKRTAESFGYEPYDASVLEPTEIYTEKSGEEMVNEQTFTFLDRGERSVTLRPEMTPTVARMVAAKRRELGFPLRWYSIPNLFRYEATQRGRLREHWQLNVDIFGVSSFNAEAEVILLADKALKAFGATSADYEIRLNTHAPDQESLNRVMEVLTRAGVTNFRIDDTLKRGQAYYTGVVFEFFDTNPTNNRSILGGGRYDNLTALFGDADLPAAGFGWGDVTTKDFLETHGLLPEFTSATKIYIALISTAYAATAVELANELREIGLNVAIDWSEKKVGDQIKNANKHKIPYVIVIGEDEAKSGTYKLKDLKTGEETEGSVESLKLELAKRGSALFARRAQDKTL